MIYDSKSAEKRHIIKTAEAMIAAARTAPKAHGYDKLELLAVDGEEKDKLAEAMREIAKTSELDFLVRDAGCVDAADGVVLFGTRKGYYGVNCGLCGKPNCAEAAKEDIMCFFVAHDLGLAVGSAVSIAADYRVDSRVMYSAGAGAIKAGFFPEDVKGCIAVPISVSGKSVFFDREKKED